MREEHLEGRRANQGDSEDPSAAAGAADSDEPTEGVLTLVCFQCGNEYHFSEGAPPDDLACDKCRGTVFRSFYTPDPSDEAARDFRETTSRDLDPDQPSTDTRPGDVLDLGRG